MDTRSIGKRSLRDNINWSENEVVRHADSRVLSAHGDYETALKETIKLAQSLLATWQNSGVVSLGLADLRATALRASECGAVLDMVQPLLSTEDKAMFRRLAEASHGRGPLIEEERPRKAAGEKIDGGR